MADPVRQGGGAHPPVFLDPVQDIVNVHWGAFTHVAFDLTFSVSYSQTSLVFCSPGVPFNIDNATNLFSYTHQINIHRLGTPSATAGFRNGSWEGVAGDPVENLPSPPGIVGFGPWTFFASRNLHPNEVTHLLAQAFWHQGSGDTITLGDQSYKTGTSATFEVQGEPMGGPGSVICAAGVQHGIGNGSELGTFTKTLVSMGTWSAALAGALAILDGKAYRPIGFKAATGPSELNRRTLRVVCARAPDDDQTA